MQKLFFLLLLLSSTSLQASITVPGSIVGSIVGTTLGSALGDETWYERHTETAATLHLYFYWSNQCPHCQKALVYLENLELQRDDIVIHNYQLVGEPENITRYEMMAAALAKSAQSVPAFFMCNTMLTGFDQAITPQQIETVLSRCQQYLASNNNLHGFAGIESDPLVLDLPFFGAIQADISSLPIMTLVIAAVDAFNPCAFFVLMFLLSLLIHTRNRKRMLLVGGVFVFFSGLMYFLFMTAWLNLFRVIGQLDVITIIAASVAVVVGLINIKDFFWFKQGVSLTLSEQAKPKLFQRMRGLLQVRSLPVLLAATISLALFANMYEFLCTAGFPMVYTRILTLSDLTTAQYYAYLLLYNVVYIVPLLIIVLLFVTTMGARKLQESEGRGLKLFSGTMMLALGIVLLFVPSLLQNLVAVLFIVLSAILIAASFVLLQRVVQK
ncbi:MAG: hypothetical protein PVF28_04525, partial [Thioalkalispiraceae bacterium]|jgi:hypothetical protein